MPLSGLCWSCGSQFVSTHELDTRVNGDMVTTHCPNCSAEVIVDDQEPPTLPLQLRATAAEQTDDDLEIEPITIQPDSAPESMSADEIAAMTPGLLFGDDEPTRAMERPALKAAEPSPPPEPQLTAVPAQKAKLALRLRTPVVSYPKQKDMAPPAGPPAAPPRPAQKSQPQLRPAQPSHPQLHHAQAVHVQPSHSQPNHAQPSHAQLLHPQPPKPAPLPVPVADVAGLHRPPALDLDRFGFEPPKRLSDSPTTVSLAPEAAAPHRTSTEPFSTGNTDPDFYPHRRRRTGLVLGALGAGLGLLALALVLKDHLSNEAQPNLAVSMEAAAPALPQAMPETHAAAVLEPLAAVVPVAEPEKKLEPAVEAPPKTPAAARPAVTRVASSTIERDSEPSRREALEKPEPAEPAKPPPVETQEEPEEPTAPFNKNAAQSALAAAGKEAASCIQPEDPPGAASVMVTFASSGRVTTANVIGPPFAGTATGGCIAAKLRKAKVPPFAGEFITVNKTVSVR